MKTITKILIPFDFSNISKAALQYAINYIGLDEHYKIVLAYIANNDNYNVLNEAFNSIQSSYGMNLKHKFEWVSFSGNLSNALLYIQKEENIDLIMMGTEGDHGFNESNTADLVLKADCPVLVIPTGYQKFKLKDVAFVLGTEEIEDEKNLYTLLKFVRKFNAKVHVITIKNEDKEYGYSVEDEKNELKIQHYLENFYCEHVLIENTDVVEGILDYTKRKKIDTIAIFPRNHAKKGEPSKGQLTEVLTLKSQIPILAID